MSDCLSCMLTHHVHAWFLTLVHAWYTRIYMYIILLILWVHAWVCENIIERISDNIIELVTDSETFVVVFDCV